jgi:hypothetical protein
MKDMEHTKIKTIISTPKKKFCMRKIPEFPSDEEAMKRQMHLELMGEFSILKTANKIQRNYQTMMYLKTRIQEHHGIVTKSKRK